MTSREDGYPAPASAMNDAWLTLSRFRRRRFPSAISLATEQLKTNPKDEMMWWLKARAMTLMVWVEDLDDDEQSLASMLLDDQGMAALPRPGTSLKTATSSLRNQLTNAPSSARGRVGTGFARPSTRAKSSSNRVGTRAGLSTGRPLSVAGRYLRPGTTSLLTGGGSDFILASRINTSSFASRPPLARALIDYLLYHDHNPRVALSVCAALSEKLQFSDSWVKARMGKCYLQLGLHREAEQQYTSALRGQRWPWVALELAQVYLALDQPLKALDTYYTGMTDPLAQGEVAFLLFAARTHVRLGEDAAAAEAYRNVLVRQPTSVEAMATLAAQLYGLGHPERAERLYRRAGLLGAGSAALVNNLAVCALGSGQSDVSLYWLQRALALARGDEAADVWFNVGHVGLMSGDETMAEQALKNCLAVKGDHAEALNNLGVLELRRADSKTGSSATSALLSAKSLFNNAVQADSLLGDAHLNLALTCLRLGKLEDAFASATLALNAGAEANELVRVLSERMRGAA